METEQKKGGMRTMQRVRGREVQKDRENRKEQYRIIIFLFNNMMKYSVCGSFQHSCCKPCWKTTPCLLHLLDYVKVRFLHCTLFLVVYMYTRCQQLLKTVVVMMQLRGIYASVGIAGLNFADRSCLQVAQPRVLTRTFNSWRALSVKHREWRSQLETIAIRYFLSNFDRSETV